jgi:hypothetical protein
MHLFTEVEPDAGIYESGYWAIGAQKADRLRGAEIYFHEKQSAGGAFCRADGSPTEGSPTEGSPTNLLEMPVSPGGRAELKVVCVRYIWVAIL